MCEKNDIIYVSAKQCITDIPIVTAKQCIIENPIISVSGRILDNDREMYYFYDDEWTTTEKVCNTIGMSVFAVIALVAIAPFSIPYIIASPFFIAYKIRHGIPICS